ncbi:MAG: phosphotransferase [Rhodothalassiaceae bacterium]
MMRLHAARDFLARTGWEEADLAPIPGDASFRRYARLRLGRRRAILMDAPPKHEDVRPFLAIARLLGRWGFSAPDCLAADIGAGFLLLEDLGDARYGRILADDPARETSLYREALGLLVALHMRRPPTRLPIPGSRDVYGLPPYDESVLMRELRLFPDWYLKARDGGRPDDAAALEALFAPLFACLDGGVPVLVLRDYHADNLMWLPRRQGLKRVGLLDFQDALIGHPAYDVVSLLQDARRDVPPALESAMISWFLGHSRERGRALDEEAFARDYAILGAQRAMKILGIFTRLDRRDGKSAYLVMLPRVKGLLARNLSHPVLLPLRDWLAQRLGEDVEGEGRS